MSTKVAKVPEVKTLKGQQKKFMLFQIILAKHIKAKLEKKLKVKKVIGSEGAKDIPSFLLELLSEKSPAVQFKEEVELTEQLLYLYKDAANMYSMIDNPGNCQDGYYVCTVDGVATCCKGTMQFMETPNQDSTNQIMNTSKQDSVNQPNYMVDLKAKMPILYWNCDVTLYQKLNDNKECKKVEFEKVLLRPKSGIKILDLNTIDNIKTIHFGAPYDIFIDL